MTVTVYGVSNAGGGVYNIYVSVARAATISAAVRVRPISPLYYFIPDNKSAQVFGGQVTGYLPYPDFPVGGIDH